MPAAGQKRTTARDGQISTSWRGDTAGVATTQEVGVELPSQTIGKDVARVLVLRDSRRGCRRRRCRHGWGRVQPVEGMDEPLASEPQVRKRLERPVEAGRVEREGGRRGTARWSGA